MPSGDVTQKLSSTAAITIGLASLAASSTLNAGRESNTITPAAPATDQAISGKIRAGTSPTAGTQIQLWIIPTLDQSGTYPDVFDGTDSAETCTSPNVLASLGRMLWEDTVDATSDRDYFVPWCSVRELFGTLPPAYVVFVTQNTGQALNATSGNHVLNVTTEYKFITP
jgi:hypothetical protein